MDNNFDFENNADFYLNEVYGIIVIDMEGKLRYLNKQCMKLIGYPQPELLDGPAASMASL